MKIGLKLWSNNSQYWPLLSRLHDEGMFDYVELFAVPGTIESTGRVWRSFDFQYIVHAPHYGFKVNPSRPEFEKQNFQFYNETRAFADLLSAPIIIVHCGVNGTIKEVIRQFKLFNEPRFVVENKPVWGLGGERCMNTTIEEMKRVTQECGLRFCLDIGHAIGSANTLKKDPYEYVSEYRWLGPVIYHLSDGDIRSETDAHQHFGRGNYDIPRILSMIDQSKMLSIETEKDESQLLDDTKLDHDYIRKILKRNTAQ
jgi:deoxyribonuclease IV